MALLFKDGDYVRIDRKRSVDVERRPRARSMGLRSGASSVAMFAALAFTGAAEQAAAASTCGDGSPVTDGNSCDLSTLGFNPRDNDNQAGAVIAEGGDTITLTGSSSSIAAGAVGWASTRLGDIVPSTEGMERLLLGEQSMGVGTPDPITHGTTVVRTYSSDSFTTRDWGDHTVGRFQNVNDEMYVDARLGTAKTGGTLAVNIGDPTKAPSAGGNLINMNMKRTDLTKAEAGSTVEWTSRNTVMSSVDKPANPAVQGWGVQVPVYAGTFTGFDGDEYTVNNLDDLKAYNDRLVGALASGALNSQAAYNTAFAQAVTFESQTVQFANPVSPDDEVAMAVGNRSVIHAQGAGALGVVRDGGQIDVRIPIIGTDIGPALWASDGGTVQVDRGGKVSGQYTAVVRVDAGSAGINNGVISSGYLSADDVDTRGVPTWQYHAGYGAQIGGAGATFVNDGIMNVAGYDIGPTSNASWQVNSGIDLHSGASATSSGTINVAVNPNFRSGRVTGVHVRGGAGATSIPSFTNESNGEIYIGRAAQYDVRAPEAVEDVANSLPAYGILASGNAKATNRGQITIGGLTQGAVGMKIEKTNASAVVDNQGTISVLGAASGTPIQNIGMFAENSDNATVTNSGTIDLTGVNGVGLKAVSTGASATRVTNAGTINVAGYADPASGTRNFGVWAEGANATADMAAGSVNLEGQGAIGVHARDGATVNIGADAGVDFESGTDQIGYFTHGAGSTITNASSALEVSTERSTLFRIEDGASFNASGETLTASGKDSTIIVASGQGTTVDTGNARLNMTGDGATGIRVDGGATGHLRSGTTVSLDSNNAVAGVVDGRKIDLAGTPSSGTYSSLLTNEADISSSADRTIGFVTQSGGKLVNDGSIDLTGSQSIGVVARSGGVLDNNRDITIANGIGVLVEGAGAASQLSNNGTITVNDGRAGVQIQDGASLVATNGTGSIVTDGSAHGVLVGLGATGLQLGANTITVNGTGNGVYNTRWNRNISFAGTTINVADGAGISTAVTIDPDSDVTINVNGSGEGVAFNGSNVTLVIGDEEVPGYWWNASDPRNYTASDDLVLGSGYVINAHGVGATGIRANTAGTIDTSAQVTVTNAEGGSALVAGPAPHIANNGSLVSLSTAAPTVDLTDTASSGFPDPGSATTQIFVNRGTIAAPVDGVAILGGDQRQGVYQEDGSITGKVDLAGGDDIFEMSGGTFTGELTTGAGDDLATFRNVTDAQIAGLTRIGGADGNDRLVFDNSQTTGTQRLAEWNEVSLTNQSTVTADGDLKLASQGKLNVEVGTAFLAGNNVNATISADGGPATVFNAGLIDLTNGTSGASDTLTIEGDYVGQGGTIAFDTELGDDNSRTDKLHVKGDTSGDSKVKVKNAGGQGDYTTDGIKLIEIDGRSDGDFALLGDYVNENGRQVVVGGLYAYTLEKDGLTDQNGDWYLRSELDPDEDKDPPVVGPDPDEDKDPPVVGPDPDEDKDPPVVGPDPDEDKDPPVVGPDPDEDKDPPVVGPDPDEDKDPPVVGPDPDEDKDPPVVEPEPEGPKEPEEIPGPEVYQAGAPIYEQYPQALQGLNDLPTLRQRVGQHAWQQDGGESVNGSRAWGRVVGKVGRTEPTNSTTGAHRSQNQALIQMGVDVPLVETEDGALVAGINGRYGQSTTDVRSRFGTGKIETDVAGVGGTLTWYGDNGLYADAQAQYSWYDSDLTSRTAETTLAKGNKGHGVAGSIETGWKHKLDDEFSLTPQAQLTYSQVGVEAFKDAFDADVSLDRSKSLRGRLGVALDHETSRVGENGQRSTSHLYVQPNLHYEFLNGSQVTVAGQTATDTGTLATRDDRLWGGLAVGGTNSWNDGKVQVFGEVTADTSLNNPADSYNVGGRVGLRIKW